MALDDILNSMSRMVFHSPMTEERGDRIAAELASIKPSTVADYACGWGELMLRVLALAPDARGFGVDLSERDLARGRANAAARGLADRVEFVNDHAGHQQRPTDVVINCGGWQAFGRTVPKSLETLR